MIQSFKKITKISGTLTFPGDKSISHRGLLISSLADGKSIIRNLSEGEDIRSTINCLKELGIEIESENNETIVNGRGFKGYQKPSKSLNAGNSGTTARLLSGILAAQNFESIIVGDKSLSSRPMKRVIDPLTQMGLSIKSDNDGKLPLKIFPSQKITAITYIMPIASAQVKSTILFAGLHLDDETLVIESQQTRNHTENLLDLSVIKESGKTTSSVSKRNYPESKEYFIPGDISSAMFFVILTLLTKNSELVIKDICLNPTRIECLKILKRMGGNLQIEEKSVSNNEVYGDVFVKSGDLQNVNIDKGTIPLIIDEIPILTIAGILAEGEFEIKGASELKVKESDRINAICDNLKMLGLDVEEFHDGFRVSGKIKKLSEPFESFGDHRIAMSFAILSSLLDNGGEVKGFECVSITNPHFVKQLHSISD